MLRVEGINTFYGTSHILHGVTLDVNDGELVSVLGRNGAGKTTVLKAIMGLLPATRGSVAFRGAEITRRTCYDIARSGIAYVPETRDIFPSLTVAENLALAARLRPVGERRWTMERALAFFPRLVERLGNGGNQLSGGEQQMLAIARALLTNPLLLILDEPTEGLAPIMVRQIHRKLAELKAEGATIILVEQNFGFATSLADDVAIIGRGRKVWSGPPETLRAEKDVQAKWLGV
jgi:branched-chain amino acid transport system ATP-binding protein